MAERYVPKIPFEGYKWFFATKAPTESLGDPAVLLGLVNRMAKIENGQLRYSSKEFADALVDLDNDIHTPVDLSNRTGERNLMRNSGQYWKLFGLIPLQSTHGVIQLTPLAKGIASGKINQIDFAASMIVTFELPNLVSYKQQDFNKWKQKELMIHPFKLILSIIRELAMEDAEDGWMSNQELYGVVVPMAGEKKSAKEIAAYIKKYRDNPAVIDGWPNCVPRSNDKRFCGEYLRFLSNFGYLAKSNEDYDASERDRDTSRYHYIMELDYQIQELVDGTWSENSTDLIHLIQQSDISSAVSMSSISRTNTRLGQQRFRHDLLEQLKKCPITGVDVPNVLQAAHIKPHKFGGPESVDNGLPLRADIHCLFDAGLLDINPTGNGSFCRIESTDQRVKDNYRQIVDKYIELPSITNMEYVRWRYDNRLLGIVG